ncbi:hypothetical protein F0P96_05910 [Hymenobacter busanensis]|uniref:Uncharacterized protein n=1 Tax=Hymenobacter busanensis TaxID=2607656 RepID=A0A7L5A1Q2_9BACT|nr:hypothetical protein [Hymenobacter busanensis]KAA9338367.1 hypothetical protein F0P96_05910 [Hymenobacter busanensis]QHJ09207.1 hypothetical protein GUY19_18700 [Hymenobacter busanensis]
MEKKEVQHQVHLDAATKLLGGDLLEEATRAGLDNNLQRWIEDLKDANNPQLHPIIVDMQALKAHFGGGTIDHIVVSDLLHRLGENTGKAAEFADGNTRPRVENLGQALLQAAKQIQRNQTSAEDDLQGDAANHA